MKKSNPCNVPSLVDIRIKSIAAGVLLDDYTLERWIGNSAYDETGTYFFRLFHPNGAGSVCHTYDAFQNGQFIGTDYSSGLNEIEGE